MSKNLLTWFAQAKIGYSELVAPSLTVVAAPNGWIVTLTWGNQGVVGYGGGLAEAEEARGA